MKLIKIISLMLLLSSLTMPADGQDETQPLSPHLENVTVNPVTGFSIIKWLPSPSPDVGSYVVYTFSDNAAYAVDTIRSPYVTEYTHTGSAARYMSVTYVVAAIDSARNISPLSNSLSTIYVSLENDTCNFRIGLSWTAYSNPAYPADGYKLLISTGGGPATLIEVFPSTTTSYSFGGTTADTEYCFFISATASTATLSSSNRQCATSGTETPPAWTEAEAVSVIDKAVVISGRYDQGTDIGNFVSEIFSPGASGWIAALSAPGMNGDVVISNPGADTTIVSLYRISALNNCSKAVTPSSPLRNIVLVSVHSGTSIDLKWNNPYPSATALFSVWRDIGSGWEEIAGLLSDTLWSDDYEEFAARVSSETVAYHITASESEASGGTPVSISSVTLVPAVENIFLANAFTPDDNGTNDIFTPVLTFIPSEYEFRIYSRTGVIIFHTTKPDTGWDGRHNDKPMPSGVYLWSLRLITPSGRSETRTGTVTILP